MTNLGSLFFTLSLMQHIFIKKMIHKSIFKSKDNRATGISLQDTHNLLMFVQYYRLLFGKRFQKWNSMNI
jgi:hypothetical protein